MKKVLLFTFNLIFILHSWGQGSYIQTLNTIGDKFYIASLPKNTSQNYQKLQIEVFGGSFYSNNLGTRVYSISSRDVDGTIERVKIVKEQRGGSSDNYTLKVMETSNGYDIILESSKPWLSVNIQSCLSFSSGGGSTITPITTQQITKYDGNGVDITNTSKVQLVSIYSTNSQGYIGIGTENPEYKLDVAGDIKSKNIILPENYMISPYPLDKFVYNTKSSGQYALQWTLDPWSSSGPSLWASGFGGVRFFTAGQYRMGITNGGNVGIGTDTPQNKLDVVGTIRATEVKVEAGWADFVFDKDYKLPTLQEVENHINEHKHLPDIPSEAEVKENGVSLGEMQAKLLQKIEELTLYVIELKKENQEQSKLIHDLQGKLE